MKMRLRGIEKSFQYKILTISPLDTPTPKNRALAYGKLPMFDR